MTTLHATGWSIVLAGLVSAGLIACGADSQSLDESTCWSAADGVQNKELPLYTWKYDATSDTWSRVGLDGKALSADQNKAIAVAEKNHCTSPVGTALTLDSNGNPVPK